MMSRVTARAPRYQLPRLSPMQQLRAGRLGRRFPQLFVGLFLYGSSMALMLRGNLGLAPWDVLTQGIHRFVPLSFGTITIIIGAVVLLLWIPLKQWPGFGTVANVVVVGLAADFGLAVLPVPEAMLSRIGFMVGGVVLNGLATAIYIGSQLGPGPRDGLMTGLASRTGRSIRLIRTGIEVSVLVVGILLGGTAWVGTVLYALGVGPIVQFFLPLVAVKVTDSSGGPVGR